MGIALICLGWALVATGVVGCFIPLIPGPTIAFCALLVARVAGGPAAISNAALLAIGAFTAAVVVLDYVVPAWGASKFKCSRAGTFGCLAGTVVGLFFLPFGVVAGPFLGALAGELLSGKRLGSSFKGAVGALMGYCLGLLIKLVCCALIARWYLLAIR